MKYPVSPQKCSECSMCSLVTKDINFESLPEERQYYQCLAMMENECSSWSRPTLDEVNVRAEMDSIISSLEDDKK